MTATVVARLTSTGTRYVLPDLLRRLEALWNAHLAAGPHRYPTWPLADLYRAIGPLSSVELEARTGIARQQFDTWLRRGYLSTRSADAVAIAVGLHPALIWTGYS